MERIIRTVYGAALQTAQFTKLPLTIKTNSTLNQKFGVNNIALGNNDNPYLNYIVIGNGGLTINAGAGGVPRADPIQHSSRDAALYNHLPFIMRLPNNDIDAPTRAKYRLRKQDLVIGGVTYVAYYAKVIDYSTAVSSLELRSVNNGVVTSTDFNPVTGDLAPTPPIINSDGTITTSGDYIAATAKIPFVLNANDVTEFLNVCNIIYGDNNYATISEIGLCSGVDKSVTGTINGVSQSYTDAVGVQVCNFISTFFPLNFTSNGINTMLDLGSLEPLLV